MEGVELVTVILFSGALVVCVIMGLAIATEWTEM